MTNYRYPTWQMEKYILLEMLMYGVLVYFYGTCNILASL